jgi:hypothetical protein
LAENEQCPPNADCEEVDERREAAQPSASSLSLGFPRDTFWPKSAAAFGALGLLLTLVSAQLVSPTRRLRLRRPSLGWLRRRRSSTAPAADEQADIEPMTEVDTPAMETPA